MDRFPAVPPGVARPVSVQATFSATLVDEWAYLGVTDAVICPGSRSTPITLALAARFHAHVRLDERSAAFYALGLSKAAGRPAVVCVTSGTAAAELHPAVVEAHHARVPLIVCTADRPPELHNVGAPQTIEQVGLYAAATRWEASPGVPTEAQASTWRPLAVRAFNEAVHGSHGPGPVHLNLEFREPLTGGPGPLPRLRRPRSTRMANAGPGAVPSRRHCPLRRPGSPSAATGCSWWARRARNGSSRIESSLSETASAGRCWPIRSRAAGSPGRSARPTPSSGAARRFRAPSCSSEPRGCRAPWAST